MPWCPLRLKRAVKRIVARFVNLLRRKIERVSEGGRVVIIVVKKDRDEGTSVPTIGRHSHDSPIARVNRGAAVSRDDRDVKMLLSLPEINVAQIVKRCAMPIKR